VTHKVIKGDGQGRVNYEVAQAALRGGHQVVLVASEIAPELDSHPSASWVRIPVARWPTALLRNQIFAWRSFRWLRKHSHQLDIAHVNGFITWAASDVNTAHFVHDAWVRLRMDNARLHPGFYRAYQWFYFALNTRLERRAYRQAKAVVAVSENIRGELTEIGVPKERICIITNGVDLREFSPGFAEREGLGLPERVPLALFVGDIRVTRKNLDTVLHALVEVPGLHLAVVGSTAGSPYPQLARQLRLSSRVHFLGYRRDVPRLMRAADLFIFPSRYEPFGLVVLEAMASGLPVVTAVTTGAAGLVSAECGIVMDDPNDTGTLVAAFRQLTQNPESRSRMGQAARAVAEQHGWQQMGKQYLQVYERILGHKRAQDEGVL